MSSFSGRIIVAPVSTYDSKVMHSIWDCLNSGLSASNQSIPPTVCFPLEERLLIFFVEL